MQRYCDGVDLAEVEAKHGESEIVMMHFKKRSTNKQSCGANNTVIQTHLLEPPRRKLKYPLHVEEQKKSEELLWSTRSQQKTPGH